MCAWLLSKLQESKISFFMDGSCSRVAAAAKISSKDLDNFRVTLRKKRLRA